ncbi:hypothetical protein DM02DRAFT_659602 [Periconia macrospinosa]|uniref:Uncharacterized protein n=1 Tax=Periconia macrospinosa TaxID=97972 RepID=A0A2V1DCX4_9PLEO|nr:hypothetical protein DM02DRAFT_659602 [Periconia macrospinosa]
MRQHGPARSSTNNRRRRAAPRPAGASAARPSTGRPQGGLLSELLAGQRAGIDNNLDNGFDDGLNNNGEGHRGHDINAAAATSPRNSPSPELAEPSGRLLQSNATSGYYSHPIILERTGSTRFTQDASPPQSLLEEDGSPPLSLLIGSLQASPASSPETWQSFFVNLFAGRRRRRQQGTSSQNPRRSTTRNTQQNTSTGPTSSARHSHGAPINAPSHHTTRREYTPLPSFDPALDPNFLRSALSEDSEQEAPLLPHTTHEVVHPLPADDVQEMVNMRERDLRPHPQGGMAVVQPASSRATGQTVTVGFEVPREPHGSRSERSNGVEERGGGADWEVGTEEQRQFTDSQRGMNILDRGMSSWRLFRAMDTGRESPTCIHHGLSQVRFRGREALPSDGFSSPMAVGRGIFWIQISILFSHGTCSARQRIGSRRPSMGPNGTLQDNAGKGSFIKRLMRAPSERKKRKEERTMGDMEKWEGELAGRTSTLER